MPPHLRRQESAASEAAAREAARRLALAQAEERRQERLRQKEAELAERKALLLLAAEQAGLARAKQNMYEKRGRRAGC